jgi:hypothetical protein
MGYQPLRTGRFAPILRFGREFRGSGAAARLRRTAPGLIELADRFLDCLEGPLKSPSGGFDPLVGEYLFSCGSKNVRVAIDTHDAGKVQSERLCDWADLYFKTNYWDGAAYPEKVRPLMNGSALVTEHEPFLRSLRTAPKSYDLSCIMRVWGGEDEVSGIEHNVRLLEQAAAYPGTKRVIAYLVAGDIAQLSTRLEAAGVECITRPLAPEELWRVCAASRFVLLRLGMHGCVPWRMADMLAIGAAIILDRAPFTRWHVPLREGEHFLSLEMPVTIQEPVAPGETYERISGRLSSWCEEQGLSESLGASAAKYFDEHGSPARVGEHIVGAAQRWKSGG